MSKIVHEISKPDPDSPDLILALVPGYTTSDWFHNNGTAADYLTFLDSRLQFHGTNHDAPFPSILLVYGEPPERLKATLDQLGAVYTREEISATLEQTRLPTDHAEDQASPVIDIRTIRIGANVRVAVDTGMIGHSTSSIPQSLTLRVLSGQPARTGDVSEYRTIFGVDEETEIYGVIYQDPDDVDALYGSFAPEGRDWTDVHIDSLSVEDTGTSVSAIEPYGPGTSFVA